MPLSFLSILSFEWAANRTNNLAKVLSGSSTIMLPTLAMIGIYGMNILGFSSADNAHSGLIIGPMTGEFAVMLLEAAGCSKRM